MVSLKSVTDKSFLPIGCPSPLKFWSANLEFPSLNKFLLPAHFFRYLTISPIVLEISGLGVKKWPISLQLSKVSPSDQGFYKNIFIRELIYRNVYGSEGQQVQCLNFIKFDYSEKNTFTQARKSQVYIKVI